MKRKFSLAYLTLPGVDPVNQIRIAKETGYDYVGLRTIPMHLPSEPKFIMHEDRELFQATKQALEIAQAMQAELDAQRKEREVWNSDDVSE